MKNKIEKIYENRQKFVVIGLTGKTGSGCSTVAKILEQGYSDYYSPDYKLTNIQNRKASIIKKFASVNFINDDKKFKIIKPSTILMMLFLFDNKIIIEKINTFYNLLNMKNDEINRYKNEQEYKKELGKELSELKEIIKILDLLNKKNEKFKDFFNFLKNVKLENKDLIKENIKNIKQEYKNKLANETEEELKEEINSILRIKKDIKFINYKLDLSNFKKLEQETLTQENIEYKIC